MDIPKVKIGSREYIKDENRGSKDYQISKFNFLHPYNLVMYYFISYLFVFMFINPMYRLIMLLITLYMGAYFTSYKNILNKLKYILPFTFIVAFINFLLVHRGRTILFYMFGNPMTLESLLYSINSMMLFITIILIFVHMSLILTNSKILYSLSKILPVFAFMLNISLNYFYYIKDIYMEVYNSIKLRSNKSKFKNLLLTLQQVIIISLEDGLSISEYLHVKNYGKKRTFYEYYVFSFEDKLYFFFSMIFIIILIISNMNMTFEFYPEITKVNYGIKEILFIIVSSVYLLFPVIWDKLEVYKWKQY